MIHTTATTHSHLLRDRCGDAEQQLALRWVQALDESLPELPPDVQERLRFARERAVARTRSAVTAPVAHPVSSVAGAGWIVATQTAGSGSSPLAGWGPDWQRVQPGDNMPAVWARWLSALLPAIILVLGLWIAQEVLWDGQIEAAAEVDTALLIDDLPPQAYTDPGFTEFLRKKASP